MLTGKGPAWGDLEETSADASFFNTSIDRLFPPSRSPAIRVVSATVRTGSPATGVSAPFSSTWGGRCGEKIRSLTLSFTFTIISMTLGVGGYAEAGAGAGAAAAACGDEATGVSGSDISSPKGEWA